jgi:hypothetical protein
MELMPSYHQENLKVIPDIFPGFYLYRIYAFKSELHLYELYANIICVGSSPRLLRRISKLQRIGNHMQWLSEEIEHNVA